MQDLANKPIYKLMWLPDTTTLIWDVITETALPITDPIYQTLPDYLNLTQWARNYTSVYNEWLNDEANNLYDLQNSTHQQALKAIQQYNEREQCQVKLYYWFDVDRTEQSTYQWTHSPLSQTPLTEIPMHHYLNRWVAVADNLIFPELNKEIL